MANYTVTLANTFSTTNSPLVLEVAYDNIKSINYTCKTLLPSNAVRYNTVTNDYIQKVTNNIIQVAVAGSYHIYVYDTTSATIIPLPFSFYAFDNLHINNKENILQIFSQELPTIYKNTEQFNYADNLAIASVINRVYDYMYGLYYDSLMSVGTGNSYNVNWELVYVGVKNFLSQAFYPSQFINTLIKLGAYASMRVQDISITLSKIMYQYLNIPVPVSIVYDAPTNLWTINIYYTPAQTWLLGVAGSTELGVTTYLSNINAQSGFLWFIAELAERLMPSYVKYKISYINYSTFLVDFNTTIVDSGDYYSENFIYEAYMTVNNNNNYHTRGYILN
jgi:hypothetical protein